MQFSFDTWAATGLTSPSTLTYTIGFLNREFTSQLLEISFLVSARRLGRRRACPSHRQESQLQAANDTHVVERLLAVPAGF